jgi:hypothetical protein
MARKKIYFNSDTLLLLLKICDAILRSVGVFSKNDLLEKFDYSATLHFITNIVVLDIIKAKLKLSLCLF